MYNKCASLKVVETAYVVDGYWKRIGTFTSDTTATSSLFSIQSQIQKEITYDSAGSATIDPLFTAALNSNGFTWKKADSTTEDISFSEFQTNGWDHNAILAASTVAVWYGDLAPNTEVGIWAWIWHGHYNDATESDWVLVDDTA